MSKSDTKQASIAVYEILKQYSSWRKSLNQNEIQRLLEENYRISLSRNTLSDTLHKLIDFYADIDERIQCTRTERRGAKGGTNDYCYGYYFDHENADDTLMDEEISLLIDTCLYARNMEIREAKKMIHKLYSLATTEQKEHMDYLDDIPQKQFNTNRMTTQYINTLRRICSKNKGKEQVWVSFHFCNYDSNKKLVVDKSIIHLVLPLAVCEANHKYYLIGAVKWKKVKLTHFRIDLMKNLSVKDISTPINQDKVSELRKKLRNMSEYMSTHLYMFYDEPQRIQLEIPKTDGSFNATFLVDAFGTGENWSVADSKKKDSVKVSLICSPDALVHFIMQYADKGIRVVGPPKVKKYINDRMKEGCKKLMGQMD